MTALRILGIDPGLQRTGFGVIEVQGHTLHYVASGVISTTTVAHQNLPTRLQVIVAGLQEVISRYQPQQVAVEEVFVNVNPKSTLLLGQARGAAISVVVMHDLPVAEYTALQIKQSVVGSGHAHKTQVQVMIKHLLQLPVEPRPDSADALACAVCHAYRSRTLDLGPADWQGRRIKRGRFI